MTESKSVPLRENGVVRYETIEVEKKAVTTRVNLFPRQVRTLSDALGPARLSFNWLTTEIDINDELVRFNYAIRMKARSLEVTSPYVARFLSLAESNVVGAEGFRLQVKARDERGEIDKLDSSFAEALWKDYSRASNVSVTTKMNLRQLENFTVRSLLRDGEVFLRKIIRKGRGKYPMKIQVIPPEWIDENFNREPSETQNEVIMGIEVDTWGAPVAYYMVWDNDVYGSSRVRTRIPAKEMIHIFVPTRPEQVRGYSALTNAIFALKMLDGYKEASMTNARVGSSKMGFFTRNVDGSAEYTGDAKDSDGNIVSEVSPGQFEVLPPGMDFKSFDPTFPADQFDTFTKSIIRSIASGWGISYNGLANDYREVNYSSARVAQLEERELWRTLQKEVSDQFLDPLYEEWLSIAIMTQVLPVPDRKFDKFNEKKFIGRTWTWIDPQNEVGANVTAIENGLTSRTRVCAGQGLDYDEIIEELAHEKDVAETSGVVLGKPVPAPPVLPADNNMKVPPV